MTRFNEWLQKVNEERKAYWEYNYTYRPYQPLTYTKGSKWCKVMDGNAVWAFIAMGDGEYKGIPLWEGDLMKPATWNAPAKRSRGNIFRGTDSWDYWGPVYLK
jgi:hypothetical protein